jgi:hypothetical protein
MPSPPVSSGSHTTPTVNDSRKPTSQIAGSQLLDPWNRRGSTHAGR